MRTPIGGSVLSTVLLGQTRFVYPSGRLPVVYDGEAHLLTIAEPGSGKSRSVAMPGLIRWPGSMLVLDFGGHLASQSALWRAAALGQKVWLVDPFSCVDGQYVPIYAEGPAHGSVNAIDTIRRSVSPLTTAIAIAAAFVVSGNMKEEHWTATAQLRIAATMLFVAFDDYFPNFGLARDMQTVWFFLSNPELEREALHFMAASEDPFIADQAAAVLRATKNNVEMQNIRNQVRGNLAGTFGEPKLLRAMSESSIDFSLMNKVPTTVYLCLPGNLAPHLFRFLRYFISICLAEIEGAGQRDRNSSQPPTMFLLDEFATLGPFPMVLDAMGRMRKYGVKFHTFIQNLSQIKHLYGEGYGVITGNAGVMQYFGGTNDRFTAEEMSTGCGTKTEITESWQDSRRPGEGGGHTQSLDGRRVYMPDEIMRLKKPEQIIKRTGENPMREHLFEPGLSDFPDYLAFMAANENGALLSEAVKAAIRASRAA